MAKKPFEDYGKKKVDGQLKDLESRLSAMYDKAGKEVTRDLNAFMSRFNASDILKKEQLQRGEITESQYKDWREAQIFRQDLMKSKIEDLSQKMVNVDKEAMAMVNNELPQAYATSYNWGGFRGEKMAEAAGFDYTQFNIVNADAVRILATEDPDLIPWKPMPDEDKDKAWNRKHVQDAIHQGIVQGDSMDKIANRLLPVVNMDKNASIRTARTAVTGVENKARKDATERVREAGIPMVEVWSCTHDSRTRDTHILLDGTEPNDEGLYGEGILDTLLRYPADPSGDPEEVYNCRCGTLSTIKGIDHSKDQELYEQFMSDNYEEDWERVKEQREEKEQAFQANKAGAAERVEERRQKAQADVDNHNKTVETGKEEEAPKKTNAEVSTDLMRENYERHRLHDNLDAVPADKVVENVPHYFDVDLSAMSEETQEAINDTLQPLMEEYNSPLCRLKTGEEENPDADSSVIASTWHAYETDSATIWFNSDKMGDYDTMIETVHQNVEKGYFAKIPPEKEREYIVTHEFAHTLMDMKSKLDPDRNFMGADYDTVKQARREIQAVFKRYTDDVGRKETLKDQLMMDVLTGDGNPQKASEAFQDWQNTRISKYSLANADEFLAESFANERLGVSSNPYAREAVDILDKYFGR